MASFMNQTDERTYGYYTGFLFGLLFICFAGAIIGDSTAEALLLSRCNLDLLPKMFLFNAAGLFVASAFIMPVIDRVDRGRFFMIAAFGHAAVLLAVRAAIMMKVTWLFPPLFTYAYIAKILLFLLFWTLANDLIDSRRAQKKFPLIAAGGTLGAIIVAFSIPGIVRFFAAENLLFVWSGCACLLGLLFIPLRKRAGRSFLPSSDRERHRVWSLRAMAADMKMTRSDPLLSTMALLYGMLFFTLFAQHYFFYVQIKEHFVTANRIAAFLGFFSGISMLATMALQFTVAGKILKRFGSSRSMLFLPAVLCGVFITLTVLGFALPPGSAPLFAAIVAGMGLRIAFFDTFFSPNFQIFFSSLPREMRGRTKLALEGVVKPAAISCAGVWLLFGVPRISFAVNMIVLFSVAALVLLVTVRLKTTYAESLTRFLSSFSRLTPGSSLTAARGDAGLMTLVGGILTNGDYEIQKFLIDELSGSGGPEFIAIVKDHVRHPDPRVRAHIVSALGRLAQKEFRELIVSFLSDPDERVVANAILALGNFTEPDTPGVLAPFLSHPGGRCRANAAMVLWNHDGYREKGDIVRNLAGMLDPAHEDECAAALYALGEIDAEETFACLRLFAEKHGRKKIRESAKVFRQFAQAAGKKSDPAAISLLLEHAKGATRLERLEIVSALVMMVERGLPFDRIVQKIRRGDPLERNILVRAIHESARKWPPETKSLLRTFVEEETGEVEQDRESLVILEPFTAHKGVELLTHAIREESVTLRLETMMYAVSILDESKAIRAIIPRLFHADPHVRARAFEVLDNTGDVELNRKVMKTLDATTLDVTAHTTGTATPVTDAVVKTVVGYIANVNTWISRCAACAVPEVKAA
jgi:AAA family ATP:ADP antiporter